jgi:hypothetical protein
LLEAERKSSYFASVYHYHKKTVESASGIVGTIGKKSFRELSGNDIMKRVSTNEVRTLCEKFPEVDPGCLLNGLGPEKLQNIWDNGVGTYAPSKHWIY